MDEQVIEMIRDDIKELKSDVKSLLQFKWQAMGVISVVSVITTLVIQLFFK